MAELTIRNVAKNYGDVLAIANTSFAVANGEFLVLVGPSGCGKSTLLRMIAGLEVLSAGSIHMDDRDVSIVDPKDRDVAMVFQNYALYPHMSVFDNMAFCLEQRRFNKDQIKTMVMEAARTLDLEELLDRKPQALSGGQRQRVAMGRAIVRNPAVYLMDEPLSNLDAKLRVQMRSELKLLRNRLGVTTVYVTHDQIEAMTLGDKVAVLAPIKSENETNLQQIDSPQALYLAPSNMFVAGFIGSPAMNFLYADVESVGNLIRISLVGLDTVLHLSRYQANNPDVDGVDAGVFNGLKRYAGKRVVAGIRPEHFMLMPLSGKDDDRMSVDVMVSELVGPDAYLHFDLPVPVVQAESMRALATTVETGKQASRFCARVDSSRVSREKGATDLFIDTSKMHFFDSETTDRIRA